MSGPFQLETNDGFTVVINTDSAGPWITIVPPAGGGLSVTTNLTTGEIRQIGEECLRIASSTEEEGN